MFDVENGRDTGIPTSHHPFAIEIGYFDDMINVSIVGEEEDKMFVWISVNSMKSVSILSSSILKW